MTTFNFTGGALSNLVGNTPGANVSNLVTLLNDLKTFLNGGNLGVGNIATGGVTAALIETQQAWQTVALTGFNASTPNLSYYKDSLGMVHLLGDALVTGGSAISALGVLCTLPAGARPGTTQNFGVVFQASAGGTSPISITTAGVVTATAGLNSNTAYSFGHVHFRAEN